MKAFALFFLINTIAPALAFGQVATTSDPQPTKNYGVDCSIVASSPGCKSYNELLASKDEQIWQLMKFQNALVCFREAEDVFTIVSFTFPPESHYKKDPKSPLFLSAGSAVFVGRFSSGFSEGVKYISGNWIRRPRGR